MNKSARTIGFRSLITAGLTFSIFLTSSALALAAPERKVLLGEVSVSGLSENGEPPFVIVNGEKALSGRTFSPSGVIETTASNSADLSLGSIGRIALSPNSKLSLTFTESSISGKLYSGKMSVFNSKGVSVNIETPDNELSNNAEVQGNFTVDLSSGKTQATAESGSLFFNDGTPAGNAQAKGGSGGNGSWIPVAVFGGIVGVAVIAVLLNRNDNNVVSPVR